MNCKPGDLAIVVKSWAGNEGKLVKCIRIDKRRSKREQIRPDGNIFPPEIVWIIDPELPDFNGVFAGYISDSQLRPIRPNDGEDEMIRIAGKPHDTHKSTPETA